MTQPFKLLNPSYGLDWGPVNGEKVAIAFIVAFCTEVSNYLCDVTPSVNEGIYGFSIMYEDHFSPEEIATLPQGWDAILKESLRHRLEYVAELTRKDHMAIRVHVQCLENGVVTIVADAIADAIKELYI